jgi:hypothetical protein
MSKILNCFSCIFSFKILFLGWRKRRWTTRKKQCRAKNSNRFSGKWSFETHITFSRFKISSQICTRSCFKITCTRNEYSLFITIVERSCWFDFNRFVALFLCDSFILFVSFCFIYFVSVSVYSYLFYSIYFACVT